MCHKSLFLLLAMMCFIAPTFAQEAAPGDSCTAGETNFITQAGGPETGGILHLMRCDGSNWQQYLTFFNNGFAGVGVASPQTPLDVAGEIKVGTTSGLSCNASREGAMRYDIIEKCIQLCNGTAWNCMVSDSACDNTPASFNFTDLTNQATSTLLQSDILEISGTDVGCTSDIAISGDGSPEYRVCADASCTAEVQTWTTSNLGFDIQGRYVQLRATSPSTDNTTHSIVINIGTGTNTWTVATASSGACGASPTNGDICSDGTVYAGISPDGNVDMYVARCDIGQAWDGSVCADDGDPTTSILLPWNNGNSLGRQEVGASSSFDGDGNTAAIIVVDSDLDTVGFQPHQAAQACADLNVHGHTDWYLPSSLELRVIYNNLVDGVPQNNIPDPLITGFATGRYWTSVERSADRVRDGNLIIFSDGSGTFGDKYNLERVRCARK